MVAAATSHKVAESLYLVQQPVAKEAKPAKPVPAPVNHLFVVDCSGSMSYDLPKIREQLKKKLPKLLQKDDTMSIIWFSGRKQFGTLLEAEPVATLTDLQAVNSAIDRWLKPICLTGFKEPLEEAQALVQRVAKKNPKGVFSLLFLSDGCDNQWPRPEVLKAVEVVAGGLSSATFVEYGNYADRPLLTAMAQKAGGTLIFAEDFDRYAPLFEGAMGKTLSGAPRIEVKVEGDAIEGFAFSTDASDLICYEVTGNKAAVPEDTAWIAYLSPTPVGTKGVDLIKLSEEASKGGKGSTTTLAVAYAAVSLFALRMKSNTVLALLKALGDVTYIESFAGCFGKQKYSEFMDKTKAAAFGQGRFENGWDPNKIPPDDAFTVLDLLHVLAEDDDNRLLLDSPDFKYTRIGRATVDPAGDDALKFEAADEPNGYPVHNLTFNEDRPNISVLIRKEGTVDLSKKLGKKEHPKVPRAFPTFIHRNYAIVKDGLINVNRLPVRLTKGTLQRLTKDGMPIEAIQNPEGETLEQTRGKVKKAAADRPVNVVLDLRAIPIINRKMVKDVSAKTLFEKAYELLKAQAAQKVYNTVKKEKFPRESEGFKMVYGEEAATWLKEAGITDFNGFNPKRVQAEASDFYLAKELSVKIKGLSSLPSLNEYNKQAAKGKLNAGAGLMAPYVKEVETFLASDTYKKAKDQDKVFEAWLDSQHLDARKTARKLIFELATVKFGVIVGQIWPVEFKSLDETTLDIDVGGTKLSCTLEAREVQQNI
jgi:hypothetical protein